MVRLCDLEGIATSGDYIVSILRLVMLSVENLSCDSKTNVATLFKGKGGRNVAARPDHIDHRFLQLRLTTG